VIKINFHISIETDNVSGIRHATEVQLPSGKMDLEEAQRLVDKYAKLISTDISEIGEAGHEALTTTEDAVTYVEKFEEGT